MRLTDEAYWNEGYNDQPLGEAIGGPLENFLGAHLTSITNATCLEIGSFPGSYLPVIGRKGYNLSGIDFNKRNERELPQWLQSLGLPVGDFWSGDFFEFIKDHTARYDLVCSFGFIEHFENFPEVIEAHVKLLKPSGKIVITTPNFRGWMQYWPHRFLDNENLKKHHIKSMSPAAWKKQLEALGFTVTFAGYFGKYYFWTDDTAKRSGFEKFMLKSVNRIIFNLNKLIKKSGMESKSYSAFCGIVAERK